MGKVKERTLYMEMKRRHMQQEITSKIIAYFFLSLGGFVMLIPFIWMLSTSLKEKGAVFTYPPEWIPRSTLTTLYQGKEYKIQETLINGQKIKFIELSSFISEPAVKQATYYQVIIDEHIECSVKLLEKVNVYGETSLIRKNQLEMTSATFSFLGEAFPVYTTAETSKFGAGVKVIILQENKRSFSITGSPIISGEYQPSADVVPDVHYEGNSYARIKIPSPENPKNFIEVIQIKIDEIKPETRLANILKVEDSRKIKATIQYVDQAFEEELTGYDEMIIADQDDIAKTDNYATSIAGTKFKLHHLISNPDKKFAIISSEELDYQITDQVFENVVKSKPVKYITKDGKESWKRMFTFKNVAKVKFYWDNYYKALFTSLPPIKAENLKGVSLLTILLTIFGQIPAFVVYFINSVIFSGAVTLLQLTTSCLAAYSFARLQWKGRNALFLAYLATMMIPSQVTMIPVFITLKKLDWIDTYKALIIPAAFTANGTFLLRQFFLSIPVELEEAATLDGATKPGILFRIILPLSKPALATLFVFQFMHSWNNFIWPLIVTNSDYMKTLPVGLASFQGLYSTDWTLLMAATIIVLLPVLVVYAFNQRFFTQGIVLSGLKG